MNMIKSYTSRSLWLAALLTTTLMLGCDNNSGDSIFGNNTLTVLETAPADTAIDVALNTNIVATFSEEMDEASITTTSFTVTGQDEDALTGSIVYDATSKTATFDPDRNLTANTDYTGTVTTAVESATGASLATNYVWLFTTGTTVDATPPTVISTDPLDTPAATDVPLNRNVTATFSEALDPTSVTDVTFTLKNGTTSVPGEVSYSSKVATFNPTADLEPTTVYTATLTTGIKDVVGNAMAADKVWTFTTGDTTAIAQGPAPVNLRTAGDFVILSKTGITNVPTSAITGDIGSSPITAAAIDVTCVEMTGFIYGADAAYTGDGTVTCFKGLPADNTLVANAVLDMGVAYTDAAGRTTPDFTELHAGDISGQTLVPGLYKWGTSVWINTNVTLDGGPEDVWIFQIEGNIIQAENTNVFLTGGAVAKNVFWQVAGGVGVDINTTATFRGVILAEKAINLKTGATVNGRLLSHTAVTLQSNAVTEPAD